MTPEEREEFEQNRDQLIAMAYAYHGITLKVNASDKVFYIANGDLGEMVEFYKNYRSEIEEVI